MVKAARTRLVFHGSVIMLIALACGLPSVVEVSSGTIRMWQAAHAALLLMAVWMLAQAAILGLIVLKEMEMSVLVNALISTGYTLAFAAIVQALTGQRVLGPSPSLVGMAVFVANLVVVLGSVLTASLTLMGARNASVHGRGEPEQEVLGFVNDLYGSKGGS
ncbi:MAG TPA: hypothetical protein VGD27_01940 [Longimicrobiales bacterium]